MAKFECAINSINDSIADYNLQLGRYDEMLTTYRAFIDQQKEIADVEFFRRTLDMEFLLKVNTQVLISLIDLAIITKNLLLSTQKWESIFFVKHAYLTIYETLKRFSSFQRKLTMLFTIDGKCREDFLQTIQSLRKFKKEYGYETHLKMVRNKVAGHVNEDFESYFTLSSSLNAKHTLEIIAALIPIFSAIQRQTTTLVQEEQLNLRKTFENQKEAIAIKVDEIEEFFRKQLKSQK